MIVRFIKQPGQADALECVRADGGTTRGEMPKQGILPRAAFHFIVETTMGWHDAFFGQIARGVPLPARGNQLDATGEAAGRAQHPDALRSASFVECLQAEQWGGAAPFSTFQEKFAVACEQHGVEPPALTSAELSRVKTALREFGAAWRPLGAGGVLERMFPDVV